jgi:hypothetical protein
LPPHYVLILLTDSCTSPGTMVLFSQPEWPISARNRVNPRLAVAGVWIWFLALNFIDDPIFATSGNLLQSSGHLPEDSAIKIIS